MAGRGASFVELENLVHATLPAPSFLHNSVSLASASDSNSNSGAFAHDYPAFNAPTLKAVVGAFAPHFAEPDPKTPLSLGIEESGVGGS